MKLSDPYPGKSSGIRTLIIVFSISLFVGFFLVIFKPFGLYGSNAPYADLWIAGYGVLTFFILLFDMYLVPLILPKTFKERDWTVLKEMIYIMFIIFTIGLVNFIYTRYLFGYHSGGWKGILEFQFYTLVIGIFPASFITISNYNRLLKKNLSEAATINPSLNPIHENPEPGDNQISINPGSDNDSLVLNLSDLVYIKAEGNYISVCHHKNNKIDNSLIRYTMKGVEEDLIDSIPPVSRTHRSFMVNLNKVESVSGNSQGLILSMHDTDDRIPVSRGYVANLKSSLQTVR